MSKALLREDLLAILLMLLFNATFAAEAAMGTLNITSAAFSNNGMIPAKYTCDGADVNPPLAISGVPENAKSLALIVDDPDAPSGMWVHWVVWNIDPKTREIAEDSLPKGAMLGMNDFRKLDYGGPCPPSGTHRYFFKVYALDALLDPGNAAAKAAVERSMKSHILDQAELVGRYRRK